MIFMNAENHELYNFSLICYKSHAFDLKTEKLNVQKIAQHFASFIDSWRRIISHKGSIKRLILWLVYLNW